MAKKLSCLKNNKKSSWLEISSKRRASEVKFKLLAIPREASRLFLVETSPFSGTKAINILSQSLYFPIKHRRLQILDSIH